jgi:site-specific recombinase XerC
MARNRTNKPQPVPRNRMGSLIEEFVAWMRVRNFSFYTQNCRRSYLVRFVRWASERGIEDPMEVTRPVLESYQRSLYYHRQKNGKPLTFRTQYARLVPVRTWFRWLVKNNHILHNPASDLDMPKIGTRLPRAVLNEEEVERVMLQPDVRDPLGVRDRAILETFYSTGIRRMELVNLKLFHVDHLRGSSSLATRSWRNFSMRLRGCASSLLSSRSADSDSSTLWAMMLHYVFQRDGVLFALADAFESALRQIQVFQVLQVFEDGFTDVVGFGAPGAPGQLLQALFDGPWKSNS